MKTRFGFLSIVLLSFTYFLAANAWAKKPVCNDGICNGNETAGTCPVDCSVPPPPECNNDGTCDENETYETCPDDCDPPLPAICNNDGICNQGEDCLGCPNDCASVATGKPSGRYCCGLDAWDEERCGASADPYCGDGNLDAGEECDDIGDSPSCDSDCTRASCGDHYTNEAAGEECDDGTETSYCDGDCTFWICGDGYVNGSAGEECDTAGETESCDIDCTYPLCGDGHLNGLAGEECDDGNITSGDGCDSQCQVEPPAPYCGDGNIDPGEECDDGNNVSGDGCDANCMSELPMSVVPAYQFNIGDSIGEAEAANGTIGSINHETVWSTGYDGGDSVNSLNERFESIDGAGYFENDSSSDDVFNRAVSGSVMADFAVQADEIVAALSSGQLPFTNGMITMLLGNNDVCAPTLDAMTDPVLFEEQYRAGLDVLANNDETKLANIHVSGIPAIYWLWNAKYSNWWCRLFVWPNVPCENLLSSPADDCASTASRLDPDNIYAGDGSNCIRRKTFHAKIRDIYNPILRDVLQEYIGDGRLPNAEFIDIFNVQFSDSHVNGG
ncbi:MAG: DUF4215 domain-containing protein, partial [Acidobacteriota bacterium]